jgi:membrane dipeptidase
MLKVADAHCDTLTKFNENPFHSKEAAWNLKKFKKAKGVLQYMAIFTPDNLSGDSALVYAFNHVGRFIRYKPEEVAFLQSASDYNEKKVNILLSIEGGSPIINDISNLLAFYKLGIRAMTLTWNHRNFLGDGVKEDYGLTAFGREVVKKMNEINMIVDVSHLNEKGFWDVADVSEKSFIASHSNVWEICNHKRNLKNDQIKEIINRKGFIGLNFYSFFIGNKKDNMLHKFEKHINSFLDLGAYDVLGFGADYDGIDESPFPDPDSYKQISGILSDRIKLTDEMIEKIMYKNLVSYTLNNI